MQSNPWKCVWLPLKLDKVTRVLTRYHILDAAIDLLKSGERGLQHTNFTKALLCVHADALSVYLADRVMAQYVREW